MKSRIRKPRTPKPKQVIGMTDIVDFPDLELFNVEAKIDTGAFTSALHCKDVRLERAGLQSRLSFCVMGQAGAIEKRFYSDTFTQRIIRNSFGVAEKRFVIKTRIVLFGRIIKAEFTLADRERMRYPVLLGRKLLRNRFIVDVSQKNLSHESGKNNIPLSKLREVNPTAGASRYGGPSTN
ncbi:hypothetical protein GCM10023189_06000 [Nibrella saemangeumensis]|uniref:Retropepsin-like aspartic endopeptidase domain-containing protein n=1 Tax=Nibrella saemangeumensis TaxID=1084526 RepID=A0ABP8MDV0_9BACT